MKVFVSMKYFLDFDSKVTKIMKNPVNQMNQIDQNGENPVSEMYQHKLHL